MKSPKLLLFVVALLFIGSTTINAQTNGKELSAEQKETMQKNMEAFVATLNLSETQQPKFEEISKKYAEQAFAVRDSDDGRFKKMKRP